MATVILRISPGQERRSFPLERLPARLGKAEGCEIRLIAGTVGRHHATIVQEGGQYFLQDERSKNGTWVGSVRIDRHPLKDGDQFRIGPFHLEFHAYRNARVVLEDDAPEGLAAFPAEVTMDRNWNLVHDVSEKFSTITDLNTLFERVFDVLLLQLPADMMVALLYDPKQGKFVSKATRPAPGRQGEEEVRVSCTVLSRVVESRSPVVVQDVSLDAVIAQSVAQHKIQAKSILAIPLVKHEKVLGIVYAIGLQRPGQFSHEDQTLLTVVGRIAGLAVERTVMAERARREAALRKYLERYFSPPVVDELLRQAEEGELPQEMRQGTLTILFCDLKGFTRMAENLPPLQVSAFLGDYFSLMSEIIFRHGGAIDKFMGDGILAIFGVPDQKPDDAERALAAALEMVDAWKSAQEERGGPRLPLRIGVNTGRAFFGTIRTPHRHDYTVLGDTVNVASRLEGLAGEDSILVGEATYEATKGRFEFEARGDTKLKGREKEMKTYRLAGKKP
jgi:adenylate cyclase